MKIRRNRKLNMRIAAFMVIAELLMLMSGLTGCGETEAEVPELIMPNTSAASSYRPVTRRRVGLIGSCEGQVVATEHPVFYTKNIELSEIMVGVGDYVNAGDVLAVSKPSVNEEMIEPLENEIDSLTRQRAYKKNVSDETVKKLGYEKMIEEYLENSEGVNLKTKEILVEQENLRYELAVIDNQLSEKRSSLSKLSSDSNSAQTFTAPISGKVTFVKDVTRSNSVLAYENIVVISDENDLYIETEKYNLSNYKYEDYKSKWAFIDGKEVGITERKYTNVEKTYAESVNKAPYMGFDVPGVELTLGVNVMLFFMSEENSPKIAVGNDSIFFDSGEYYVYVKNANGDNEKRIIEPGVSDGLYTLVKSGLEEGELVFYENTALIPEKYDIAVASIGDYSETLSSNVISIAYPYYDIYTAQVSGTYRKLRDVGAATEGDALFSIESSVEPTQLAEAKDAVDDLDNERTKSKREYEFFKSEIEEELRGADLIVPEELATGTDAAREYMYYAERKECELNILNYSEDYASKEYTANRAVLQSVYDDMKLGTEKHDGMSDYVEYSKGNGQLDYIEYDEGRTVEEGSFIMTETVRGNDKGATKLLVLLGSSSTGEPKSAKLGETITLHQDEKSWTGTCIGINGSASRYMVNTQDGQPCITYSAPYTKNVKYQFYVEMDSEITEKNLEKSEVTFYSEDMRGVVLVPATSVKTEIAKLSLEERYFVWKVEGDEIVKEYVDVYNPHGATPVKYIMNGVEPGDTVLK